MLYLQVQKMMLMILLSLVLVVLKVADAPLVRALIIITTLLFYGGLQGTVQNTAL